MAPNSYCTIVTVFFVNIIRMKFNTQIHICSLLGCLGCSAARVPWLAGSGASAGWAGSGGLAAQVLGWGLGPPGGLKSLSHPEERGVLKLVQNLILGLLNMVYINPKW